MNFNKGLLCVLLALLLSGITLNSDSFVEAKLENEIEVKMENIDYTGSLKKIIDYKIFEENGPLTEMHSANYDIIAAAYKEIGNVGGEPYWRWYGLNSRTAWCAIFVSYCANQCGYIEQGIIPKTASVLTMVRWFKNRDLWLKPGNKPTPGMIIFFDFENFEAGIYWTNDGSGDHVGIVKKVEDGYVHCIEGNNRDSCVETKYPINSRWILGYGTPEYDKVKK